MTQDDVLVGYRLRLFALAAERGVSEGCRLMGVHRSTYYRYKREVERQGLEMLRPRERRRPVMPNQLSVLVEQRIVAFSLGHPGLGPRRVAARLARPEWGGLRVSPNGVYKTLVPLPRLAPHRRDVAAETEVAVAQSGVNPTRRGLARPRWSGRPAAPVPVRPGEAVVDVDALGLDAEGSEGTALGGEVLGVGGDAGVADL
jgi:transposase